MIPTLVLITQIAVMMVVAVAPWFQRESFVAGPEANILYGVVEFFLGGMGIILIVSSKIALGRSFTVRAIPRDEGEFVRRWPYTRVRNPMYTGVLFASFAWSMMWRSWVALSATLLLIAILRIKVGIEERALGQRFGASYESYRRCVGRFFPKWPK